MVPDSHRLDAVCPHPGPNGVREIQPGIWAGLRTRIAPTAELKAPCWIGEDVQIGPHAVVGPMAILEDRVFVETGALVSHTWVGPDTYSGEFTALMNSMAWGDTLVNWEVRLQPSSARPVSPVQSRESGAGQHSG